MTDIPGDNSTTSQISVGGTLNGTIETDGDHDWVAVNLVAGQKYTFTLDANGSNGLEDPYLNLRDASGTSLAENDDGNGNHGARIVYTATTSGTYYLDASSYTDGTYYAHGDYTLSAQAYTPPPVYSYDQISDQLVNGYWSGDWHHFDVTQGGTITVNISGLTATGQTLARAALGEWSDVIGVSFKEVSGVGSDGAPIGQIVFDDSDDGAYTTSVWDNNVISSSDVNISTKWLSDYGTPAAGEGSLDTYAFQTYVHEIGHALGLGHAGNYNDVADYPDDALYANDAWSTTVMSYFSQDDSSYFSSQGFSYDFTLTPMIADIRAMQTLYGLSTTTRTGNTIYGYGTNTGNAVFNTSINPDAAYTIIDSGGTDTLNYANSSATQVINLNPETFSNVAGSVGNVSIAFGTVIENANGGSGKDTIIGNAADNVLNGNGGIDTVSYETATAGVTVDLRINTQQNTIGAGQDTLSNFESLTGSSHRDVLTGRGSGTVNGGDGDDVIHGASGGDQLNGGNGDDTFIPGTGHDTIDGGAGWDIVDFSGASAAVTVDLGNATSGGYATYTSVEEAIGSRFDDKLTGDANANTLSGGAGTDVLVGNGGNDTLDGGKGADSMSGGAGNDLYYIDNIGDTVTEVAGAGIDTVRSSISYALAANVENLTLSGASAIDGTGNSLANVLIGNDTTNTLSGGAGNDKLVGYGGNDTLDGGTGKDRLIGGNGDDTYFVDSYSDAVIENAGEGHDVVFSSANYTLRSNIEDLTLTGTAGIWGYGNDSDNVLTGNNAGNKLFGLGGDDLLDGKGGADRMFGGAGNDTYYVDSYSDRTIEQAGAGTDAVFTSTSYKLADNVENLTITGTADLWAYGNSTANSLTGNAGDNKLYGLAGNDALDGGSGNDWLEGGAGKDTLHGGSGNDVFVFRDGDFGGTTMDTADVIQDFTQGSDQIRLNFVDANTALSGDQAFAFLGTAAFDGHAGELRYDQNGGDTYVSGDTNGDGIADFMIELSGIHTLASSDFIL